MLSTISILKSQPGCLMHSQFRGIPTSRPNNSPTTNRSQLFSIGAFLPER